MENVKRNATLCLPACFVFALASAMLLDSAAANDRLTDSIVPILENHCFDCHAGGGEEGGVTFDHLIEEEVPGDPELWNRVLKQLRTGLMPPIDAEPLEPGQLRELESWIIEDVFRHDPHNPDPGRVRVRRLNRNEYRNTIRDLVKVNYDTTVHFPPDDSGEGFDNLGEVLTMSPMLMEKYIDAAQTIANEVVPLEGSTTPTIGFDPWKFGLGKDCIREGTLSIPFYHAKTAKQEFELETTARYSLEFTLVTAEEYIEDAEDFNRCRVEVFLGEDKLLDKEYERDPWKRHPLAFERELKAGRHDLRIEITPLTKEKQDRMLQIRFEDLQLRGPLGEEFKIVPEKHAAFFREPIPDSDQQRMAYAAKMIGPFLKRAFRRPADPQTVNRLCQMAKSVWQKEGGSFEQGIQQAMVAALASPRFLFREEFAAPIESPADRKSHPHVPVDEYSLASRLSYFLWGSMPDDELLNLASNNQLRENLHAQVKRMKQDRRFDSFYRNFVGQWLQTRDIEGVSINAFSVLLRESPDPEIEEKFERFRRLRKTQKRRLNEQGKQEREKLLAVLRPIFRKAGRVELDQKLRKAMRRETEMLVEHIINEDRNLTELIDCNYTFLNEKLAAHYGIENVKGGKMRLVELPPDSLRGGLLGHGSMLAITSNPDRTSPVKRGLYLLENILGMPTGAPPANIPPLEDSETTGEGNRVSLREALAVHRENVLCSSCHNRMDPLGLALENFDPLGRERVGRDIDVSGELVTGESFENLGELKKILVEHHSREIYRCVSEKMLTFALGRSLEYYDTPTVDKIVERVEKSGGSGSEMLLAVIDSVAFQRMRHESHAELSKK